MDEPPIPEKRLRSRQRVLKAATIVFNGSAGISCTVRNLSMTGAAIDVASPIGIPDTCTLMIHGNRTPQACRVVWRKATRIGVAFVSRDGLVSD